MDRMIGGAFQPGRFIGDQSGYSFVSDLRQAEEEIAKLVGADPVRAVTLCETFLAGCNAKGRGDRRLRCELLLFAGGLLCGWLKARQYAGL